MAGCKPGCGGGCHDFSSRAERLPNLLAIDVVASLLEQAIRNMTLRAASLESGMMSAEEYAAAREKLEAWLVALFMGENPHFEADMEWHRGSGLTDFLRERFNEPALSDEAVLSHAVSLFAEDAHEAAERFVAEGASETAERARQELATLWAHLFTGAPTDF